eukprot:4280866-Pyramimonas_sp.AAC.2
MPTVLPYDRAHPLEASQECQWKPQTLHFFQHNPGIRHFENKRKLRGKRAGADHTRGRRLPFGIGLNTFVMGSLQRMQRRSYKTAREKMEVDERLRQQGILLIYKERSQLQTMLEQV